MLDALEVGDGFIPNVYLGHVSNLRVAQVAVPVLVDGCARYETAEFGVGEVRGVDFDACRNTVERYPDFGFISFYVPTLAFGNLDFCVIEDVALITADFLYSEYSVRHIRQAIDEVLHALASEFVVIAIYSLKTRGTRQDFERGQLVIGAVQLCQGGVLRHIERGQFVVGAVQICQRGVL